MACDTLFSYPNFNKELKIHTDSREFQFGAVIRQKGTLLALYIRKLTDAQKKYTAAEK